LHLAAIPLHSIAASEGRRYVEGSAVTTIEGKEMPTILRDDICIYYEVKGEGPPIVLGHSFLCSGKMWSPQIEPLARRNTVINIDLRGHGHSGVVDRRFDLYDLVEDVTAVLDHLEIDRAVWVGLSIGGMVALRAAIRAQERVSGLILLDTNASVEAMFEKAKYLAIVELARLFGIAPLVPQIARMFFCSHTRRTNPTLVDEWKINFRLVPFTTVSNTVTALMHRDSVVDQLPSIQVPALVMVGENDDPTPPACAREISGALSNASFVEVKNAGHLSNLEQPGTVTSEMVAYLENQNWVKL